MGLFDFVSLEKNAKFIITDSGTVPEEATLFKVPCMILRKHIERQELLDCGSVVLAGTDTNDILQAFNAMQRDTGWVVPDDYTKNNVSDTVINILAGHV